MTALTRASVRDVERWAYHHFPLAAGKKAWRGGIACLDLATGKVVPGANTGDLLVIGVFASDVDATAGEQPVNVCLQTEIEVRWWANDTGAPLDAGDVGQLCYVLDDQTVTLTEGGPIAGRVWAVDSSLGVAVERLPFAYVAPAGP